LRFYLISDNTDTQMGMRLAGIDGVVVHERAELEKAIGDVLAMEDVGVLIMTARLKALAPELIDDIILHRDRPLIVEIPDRHSFGRPGEAINAYVKNSIGVDIR